MSKLSVCVWIAVIVLFGACATDIAQTSETQSSEDAPPIRKVSLRIYAGTSFQPQAAYVRDATELSKYLVDHCVSNFRLGSAHEGETGNSYDDVTYSAASITDEQFRWLVTEEVGESRWIEPSSYDKDMKCAK